MQVKEIPIYQFLEGSDKRFIIPVYQRDYSWTKKNCQKLWDDMLILANSQRPDHFLGTIVGIVSNYAEYVIIDGQQRLTTISIFLLSLHNFLKNKIDKSEEENRLESQLLEFLIDKYSKDQARRIRLKPNKQDEVFFNNLFKDSEEKKSEISSNIINNYNFFSEKIHNCEIAPQDLFNYFRKLKIILIDLVRGIDDPQLIFESLNSTGVDLESSDLIRNYILMDLEPEKQEQFYQKYWLEIEKLVEDEFEIFVQNYLIFKNKSWIKSDDVYENFKKFVKENFAQDKEKILQDLIYYAKIFSIIFQITKHKNSEINNCLKRFCELDFSVAVPYFLDIFTDLDLGILSEENVIKIIKTIESLAFRKNFVDNTSQGLNKLFITLAKEIKKEKDWQENYLDIFNFILLSKSGSTKFPTDDDFENAFINKEVYKTKNKFYLLSAIENYKSAFKIEIDDLEIEHIMPQNLTRDWQQKLGENYEEIHKKYLHTLGNLTLTTSRQNKVLSNLSKEEKDKIDFQTSKLKLNFRLEENKIWNDKTIVERAKILALEAKEIWQYPKTNYKKIIIEDEIFDLTSEDDFTGRRPSFISFGNNELEEDIKSWPIFLVKLCSFLYKNSPTLFEKAMVNNGLKDYFQKDAERTFKEFDENKFVLTYLLTKTVILFAKKLCKAVNYDLENVKFKLNKQKNETNI
jgi:uncharacterized protein with ParB-like and HNH nuclease domain